MESLEDTGTEMQGPVDQLEFDISAIGKILWRRIWWLAVPVLVGISVSLGVALLIPSVYQGVTTILIEPQGIPEQLVPTTVVADKEARFFNIRMQILSRNNLTLVIDELGLYPGVVLPREELIARMRESIGIEPILPAVVDPRRPLEISSFSISFLSEDPRRAAATANRLARDFIRENIEGRTSDAEGTSEFIQTEIVRRTDQLNSLAAEIASFKEQYLGELPEQLETNRRSLEHRLSDLTRKRERLQAALTQVSLIDHQLEALRASGSSGGENPTRRKSEVELRLNVLRSRGFTDRHPDVVAARAELAELESMIEASSEDGGRRLISPSEVSLQRERRNFGVEAGVLQSELETLQAEIELYETRIANSPRRASQLAMFEARHGSVAELLRALEIKKANADIGRSMEARQKGERFRIIESAELPESPVSPNRPLVFLLGIGLGLLFGLSAVVAVEATDARFYRAADLETSLALPVLVSVPVIRLAVEVAAARARLRRFVLSVAAVGVLVVGGALVYYLSGTQSAKLDPGTPVPGGERAADV